MIASGYRYYDVAALQRYFGTIRGSQVHGTPIGE
jgi:hypothetical protein